MLDPTKINDLRTAELYLAAVSSAGIDEEGFIILPNGDFVHIQGEGKLLTRPIGWAVDESNGILTHCHPMPQPEERWSLSWGDLLCSISQNYKEVRAVYPHGVYRVCRPEEGWPQLDTAKYLVKQQIEEIGSSVTLRTRFERLLEKLGGGLRLELVKHGEF